MEEEKEKEKEEREKRRRGETNVSSGLVLKEHGSLNISKSTFSN